MSIVTEADELFCEMLRKMLFPPGVEALVPVNPARLPGYIAGSIMSNDLNMAIDVVSKPLENLVTAGNFIVDGHNTTHIIRRIGEVGLDTLKINLVAESQATMGPAISGQMANEVAEKYTKQMITDYKLVDSVKQAALKQRNLRRYANGNFKATRWRGAPGSGSNVGQTMYTNTICIQIRLMFPDQVMGQ